jgi:pimeloyl-ACP methyl ester carboxylesterase
MRVCGLLVAFVASVMLILTTAPQAAQAQAPGRQVQPFSRQAQPKKVPFQPKAPFNPKAPFQPKAAAPPPKAPTPPPRGPKLPEPEELSLETKDGMTIKATYYASTAKKEAVPVIMVHGFEGQRGDYHSLALDLQRQGHASIVPDLRGHGQSKVQKRADGTPVTLDSEKLTRPILEDMIYDIQACKKFLMEKNNAGELNIEELCVIGADLGAILAVRFAAYDWSLQQLPAYKQGQDVKALVLLSPVSSLKGLTMREALAFGPVQSQLSIMFIAGSNDTKSSGEAKKIYNSLVSRHPKLPDDKEDRLKSQELFLIQPDSSLAGTKLLGKELNVSQNIARFIELRLVNRKAEFAWQERKNPLGN